uniref:Uncharacterized protein n=1 Tax=Arundo donax TaxID=35708 RepID=A0A0A9ECM0_ARUDO
MLANNPLSPPHAHCHPSCCTTGPVKAQETQQLRIFAL